MIRYFTAHPTAANLLMLIFIVLGVSALPGLRRETFPDFTPGEVQIAVPYPGASAEDIEEAVCQRIEDAVDGVTNTKEIRSDAREGLATVTVEMEEGKDFQVFLDDIKTEVDAVDDFPEEAEEPVVEQLNRNDLVVAVAVTGPMDTPSLKAYCEDLKDRLQRIESVALVNILGFSDHQFRIEIPAQALMQFGLSVSDIADVVAAQSLDLPAGVLETPERDLLVRFSDERQTVDQLRDLVVLSAPSGAEVRLGDIALISDVFEDDEQKALFRGPASDTSRRAGLLQIMKNKSQDSLTALDAVTAEIERERRRAPPGVELVLTQNISSVVRDRINLLVKNGWQGLVLVFLTMWLFFALRLSFWVALGLPISFLGAFFFMPLIDYSVNLITCVGLLIAIGLLMDDAIVISENVATHLRKGKTAFRAAIDGVNEVKVGVLASFTTTVCIFGPLAFLGGNIGKVMRVMPVMLILVLAVSLVEAFMILPHHLSHSLRHFDPRRRGRLRRWLEERVEWAREHVVGALVDRAVRARYLFIGLVFLAFFLSLGMIVGGFVKFRAFPEVEGDVIVCRLLFPQGTPLQRVERAVERVNAALLDIDRELTPRQPGGQALIQAVQSQFGVNTDANESGPHVATVTVDLLTSEERNARMDDVIARWREGVGDIPDALNLGFKEMQIGPAGLPIDIRLQGERLERLDLAARRLRDYLSGFVGVFDLKDDLRPGKPEIRLRLRDGAKSLGVDARRVASQLRAAYEGRIASEIQVGEESYEVEVRLAEQDRDNLADLEYFHVTLPDGNQAPLSVVAVAERDRGWARIGRVDGRRTVNITGDVDTRKANTAEVLGRLRSEFLPRLESDFPDIAVSLEGEAEESAKTGASLQRGFLLGLIGVFILLSFQFRSYIEPVVVMTAIPLALIGVVWGHWLLGLDLSMPSMIGFVSLAGIVVNDSILLVEFVKIHRREGDPIADSARQASRERFRAVMLTSLTTIAGLLPLLTERSLQAQILIPLAVSIVFGLLATTMLVLFVVPAFYTILGDFGLTAKVEVVEN